jgi:hypothetical protein
VSARCQGATEQKPIFTTHLALTCAERLVGVEVHAYVRQSSDRARWAAVATLSRNASSLSPAPFAWQQNVTAASSGGVVVLGCPTCLWNASDAAALAALVASAPGVFAHVTLTPLHRTIEAVAILCVTVVLYTDASATTVAATTTAAPLATTTVDANATTTTIAVNATTAAVNATTAAATTTGALSTTGAPVTMTLPTVADDIEPSFACAGDVADLTFVSLNIDSLRRAMGQRANQPLDIEACGRVINVAPVNGDLGHTAMRGLGVSADGSRDSEVALERKLKFQLSTNQLLWSVTFENFKNEKAELTVGDAKTIASSPEWLYIGLMLDNLTLPSAREVQIAALEASSFVVRAVAFRNELPTSAPATTLPISAACSLDPVACFMEEQPLFFWLIVALGSCLVVVLICGIATCVYLKRRARTTEDYSMRDAKNLDYYS